MSSALRERVAAPDTDADTRVFDAAKLAYVATHRHDQPGPALSVSAQHAGLRAVLAARASRDRHAEEQDLTGIVVTTDLEQKDRLKAAGWTVLGASHLYVLSPPSTGDGAAVDGGS